MITSGVQQALDLVLRLLVPPGQPGAGGVADLSERAGRLSGRRARVGTHAIDPDGLGRASCCSAALRQTRPRLAYLIPEFHNPTGHLMPTGLREQLVAAAHAAGTDLIVDESFVDLPLDGGAMPPPVAAFDRHARVVTIGGMSKPYWGGLRIGWVRGAAPLVARLAAVRVGVDMACPVLDQLVAVQLLDRGPTRSSPPAAAQLAGPAGRARRRAARPSCRSGGSRCRPAA